MSVNLSVIILSYNTKQLTRRCIASLIKNLAKNKDFQSEIIVIDNGSSDGSKEMIKKIQKKAAIRTIFNQKNLGYPKGNNQGLKIATGKYVLFLNSDVIVKKINFEKLIHFLDNHPNVGVLTVKVTLTGNKIDPASHRGFPTIWNSLIYFVGLENLFRSIPLLNKIFGGYHLAHLDLDKTHEIDSPSGAFYLTRYEILKKVDGFDEEFFMYGEDLDLSYRIKKLGYKVIYYPHFKVMHLKWASGLAQKDSKVKIMTKHHFFEAMKIFYRKHYARSNNFIFNKLIYFMIDVIKKIYV